MLWPESLPRRHRGVPCDRDDGIVLLDVRGHVAVVVLHLAAAAIAAHARTEGAHSSVCECSVSGIAVQCSADYTLCMSCMGSAASLSHLGLPLDHVRARRAIALDGNVSEGDNAVRWIVAAREGLLVDDCAYTSRERSQK